MKRGIRYRADQSSDLPSTWAGVPLYIDTDTDIVARSRGILFWKSIVVNDKWFYLPLDEQRGVLSHEYAHAIYMHMEIRLLAALIPIPAFWRWLAHRQELQADRHAAYNGFGAGLLAYLMRSHSPSVYHPAIEVRREALRNTLIELAFEQEGVI